MVSADMVRKKRVRPDLVLPTDLDGFAQAGRLLTWYEMLWINWPLKDPTEADLMLLTYLSLLIDTGLPHMAAIDVILDLRSKRGARFDGSVIPALRFAHHLGSARVRFSKRTRLAVYCWKYRWNKPEYSSIRDSKKRAGRIQDQLRRSYNSWKRGSPIAPIGFRSLSRLSTFFCLSRGFDPYLNTIYSGATRVTDQDPGDVYCLVDTGRQANPQMIVKSAPARASAPTRLFRNAVPKKAEETPAIDWCERAKEHLRNMCAELCSINPDRLTKTQRPRAREIIDRYRREALTFSEPDSACVVAIDYAENLIVEKGSVSTRSLRNYLDRCVINGLLSNANAASLSDWNLDDFIENFEERISRLESKLEWRTRANIQEAYRSLFGFLTEKQVVSGLKKCRLGEMFGRGAAQWKLLAPEAVDALIGQLFDSGEFIGMQTGLAIGLGYYGGLRASEVANLTCASVLFDDGLTNLDIEVLRGKTASARRRLPFDKLAPVAIQQKLKTYVLERRQSVASVAIGQIALFGPPGSAWGYKPESYIRLVRGVLKTWFGDHVNFHTMRHCFCSNLFLRWYALRYPDIREQLASADHELYGSRLQNGLNRYFARKFIDDGSIRPYDLILMVKLTGHSSPDMFFYFYVHSAFCVQKHAVELADRELAPPCPPDRVLMSLVPKMKSAASRAKMRKTWVSGHSRECLIN